MSDNLLDIITNIDYMELRTSKGIEIKNISNLLDTILTVYLAQNDINDLYTIVYIVNHHWLDLNEYTQFRVVDALSFKGVEQLDGVKGSLKNNLDKTKLSKDFKEIWSRIIEN